MPAPGRPTARAPRRRPRRGPLSACARCHARRSGSSVASVASASAPCTRLALLRPRPSGRPPSAPADAETAPARRPRAAPPRRGRGRARPIPSRPAARHSSAGSPTGSAAATSSSSRVSSGSASSRRRKLSSIRPDSGSTSGSPKPPASCAAVSPRGSSSSASGLPRVSATIRSRTRSSSRPGSDGRQQRAGILLGRARPTTSSGRPTSSRLVARLANGEHHRDRLGQQASRDESEDLPRGADRATARHRRRRAAAAPRRPRTAG